MEWIKVKDRMPDRGVHVLISVSNVDDTQAEPYIMQGYREFDTWVILTERETLEDENIGDMEFWQVSHWMTQPAPPKN